MLTTATVLFGIALAAGLWIAVVHFASNGKKQPSFRLAVAHGAIALAALAILLVRAVTGPVIGQETGTQNFGWIAIALFVAAALLGFVVFAGHLRRHRLPEFLMSIHMVVAIAGFAVLLGYAVIG